MNNIGSRNAELYYVMSNMAPEFLREKEDKIIFLLFSTQEGLNVCVL